MLQRRACPGQAAAPLRRLLVAFASGALAVGALQAAAPDDGSWPVAPGSGDNTRYSPLAQVDRGNVARLVPVFEQSTGASRGHEAATIVAGGRMFVVTPWPNLVLAYDVSAGPPKPLWRFEPKPTPAAQGMACCDVVNRGAAHADGRVFLNTLDNQTIALDAASGRELWRRKLGDIAKGETMTMAPLVVKDKVIVGNAGGEMGVRGWVAALDAASGRTVWQFFSTGPDAEVGIGPRYRPFYAADKGRDLGVSTWPPEAWKTGGGNVWGFVAYDAELDLVYHGTANPGPWNPEQRPGDNKWTSGVFARRADTGEAVWFYAWSPHDLHDYDGVNENVLVDLTLRGRPRKLLLHPDRNGYLYVLDRGSGEVLSADAFVHVTTSLGVDLANGRLRYAPDKQPRTGRSVREICPASAGAKDWQPSAWSPRTQLLYIPHQNLCQDSVSYETSYVAGTPYVGAETRMYAGPGGHRGEFSAWDPVARKKAWSIRERFPVWSGALATAGDLVFYGTMDGWFKAIDAKSGALLWQHRLPSGVIGQPVAYRGGDGRQYIAVLSGVGGWAGAVVSGDLDSRDPTAGNGFANAMRDLPAATPKGGALHVFALP